MGFGPDEMRPDRVGGYFDAQDAGPLMLIAEPSRPDPRDLPLVKAFIAEWKRRRGGKLVVARGPVPESRRGDRGPPPARDEGA
jgi:hypothetical protein